jgi:hypothetical protein
VSSRGSRTNRENSGALAPTRDDKPSTSNEGDKVTVSVSDGSASIRSGGTDTDSGSGIEASPQSDRNENPESESSTAHDDGSAESGSVSSHDSNDGTPDTLDSREDFPNRIDESMPSDFASEVQAAVEIVSQVHRFPEGMDNITFIHDDLPPGVSGRFVPGTQEIIVNPKDNYLREHLVHEIGHAMDQAGNATSRLGLASRAPMQTPAMRNFLQVVRNVTIHVVEEIPT